MNEQHENYIASLEAAFEESNRKKVIDSALHNLSEVEQIICFFGRFIEFNNYFAAGVTHLTYMIHSCPDLFKDRQVSNYLIQDQSSRIASYIFYAAEDEYSGYNGIRITHRQMAQGFFFELCRYFSHFFQKKLIYEITQQRNKIKKDVLGGYKAGTEITIDNILSSIGFHVISELSADQEFNVIHNYLIKNHPTLKDFMESQKSKYGFNPYHWIEIHTYVEKEHYEGAKNALRLAMQYTENWGSVKATVERGADNFKLLHDEFYSFKKN